VFGYTGGNSFPAVNSLPGCINNNTFVSKLSFTAATPALSFAYSTCLPGFPFINALAVDSSGSAYITGRTNGQGFPIVNPLVPPNNNLQGPQDAFLTKISFAPTTVPFASATPKLNVTAGPPSAFSLNEAIVLGAASDGINPVTEDTKLQVGNYAVTIPSGSFQLNPNGRYAFSGVINGVTLTAQIEPTGANSFAFKVDATGVNLGGIVNPVVVTVTIGDDSGSATVSAVFN
jgi:hypothetical protein